MNKKLIFPVVIVLFIGAAVGILPYHVLPFMGSDVDKEKYNDYKEVMGTVESTEGSDKLKVTVDKSLIDSFVSKITQDSTPKTVLVDIDNFKHLKIGDRVDLLMKENSNEAIIYHDELTLIEKEFDVRYLNNIY
jgi:hypothetical protein